MNDLEQPMTNQGDWLRIDERTDVLASLSLCLRTLNVVAEEPAQWKWAILSLHNALQGAMVCHLSGTANIGALSDQCAKQWWAWHERDGRGEVQRIRTGTGTLGIPEFRFASKDDHPPQEQLADANTLFKRLYNGGKRVESGAGAVLEIDEPTRQSFQHLHDLRKEFAHFTPKGWSIEIGGLPRIFGHMLDVIDYIASDHWPFRHLEEAEKTRLQTLLTELRAAINKLPKT